MIVIPTKKQEPEKLFNAEIFAERICIPCGECDYVEPLEGLISLRMLKSPTKIPKIKKGYNFACGVISGDLEIVYLLINDEQVLKFNEYGKHEKCEGLSWYMVDKGLF